MAVDRSIGILGLRIYDSRDARTVNKNWSGEGSNDIKRMWKYLDIPSGEYIIGINAATKSDDFDHITRLGWVLWKPSDHE